MSELVDFILCIVAAPFAIIYYTGKGIYLFFKWVANSINKKKEENLARENELREEKLRFEEKKKKDELDAIKAREENLMKEKVLAEEKAKLEEKRKKDQLEARRKKEAKRIKQLENKVSASSRLILKINELNKEFMQYTQIRFEQEIELRFAHSSHFDTASAKLAIAKNSLKEQYKNKEKYNKAASEYGRLFNETLKNVITPDSVIAASNLSVNVYRKTEQNILKKMRILEECNKQIAVTIKYGIGSNLETFRYDESVLNWKYHPQNIEHKYVPFDTEMENKRRFEEMLAVFLQPLISLINKKKIVEEINSHIVTIGEVHYFLFDSYALVGGCDGKSSGITLTDELVVDGKSIPVIGILENAFKNNNSLKEVILPDSIEMIGDFAFSGCYQLKEIYIPDSVKYIGENAFNSCLSLANLSLPAGTEYIGQSLLTMCGKCQITIRGNEINKNWNPKWNPDNLSITYSD